MQYYFMKTKTSRFDLVCNLATLGQNRRIMLPQHTFLHMYILTYIRSTTVNEVWFFHVMGISVHDDIYEIKPL